jgi:hypothetical protein
MKLGQESGIIVDTTRSNSVFTPANLSKYQALVLFSAYNWGVSLSAAQKTAVENWYSGNRGMACFHQCTKHSWGGAPSWMDKLMGVEYQTWAGFGTGPVYVNADVVGTDLAMSKSGTPYEANFTLTWDDEWYTYQANPDPLPNTKMIWTTTRSSHGFGGKFALAGEVQPMAWARNVEGGRYVMNSLFHQDVPRTSTNPQMREFVDGAFLGTMRYLAGYSGCTDSSFREFSPKATHMGTGACVTPNSVGIQVQRVQASAGNSVGNIHVKLDQDGPHSVSVFDAQGKEIFSRLGVGKADYVFSRSRPGMHYIKVTSSGKSISKRFLLL